MGLDVRNTGDRAGQEVVQLYLADLDSRLVRPDKELRAFEKIALSPGEATRVTFRLDERALSYFDPEARSWVAEPGEFEVRVGASASDIRQRGVFRLGT